MSKTKTFQARWRGSAMTVGLLLVIALVLVGCGGTDATPTSLPEPTEVAAKPLTPTSAPTNTPMPTDTPAPTDTPIPTETPTEVPPTNTPEPTAEPTLAPVDDSACVACHTDEAVLKTLAKEEEKPAVESEGEG